jgi:hypothetical protein
MKRLLLTGLVVLALVPSAARAVTIGLGAFGGMNGTILQDDNGNGSTFGVRVPVNFVPMLTVEPFFAKTSGGDKTQTAGPLSVTYPGIDVTSYGANVLFTFGAGFQMYPFAGVSTNTLKRPGLNGTGTGYDFEIGRAHV